MEQNIWEGGGGLSDSDDSVDCDDGCPNVLFGEKRGCYRTSLEFFSVDVGISCSCWLSILIQQKIRTQAFPRLLNWVAQRGMKSVYQKINMKSEQLKTEFNN